MSIERFDISESARRLRELQAKQTLTDGERIECELLVRKKYEPSPIERDSNDRTESLRYRTEDQTDSYGARVFPEKQAVGERRDKELVGRVNIEGRRDAPAPQTLEFKSEDVLAFLKKMHIKREAFDNFIQASK